MVVHDETVNKFTIDDEHNFFLDFRGDFSIGGHPGGSRTDSRDKKHDFLIYIYIYILFFRVLSFVLNLRCFFFKNTALKSKLT